MAAQPMTSSRGSIIGHKRSRDARQLTYAPDNSDNRYAIRLLSVPAADNIQEGEQNTLVTSNS
ncbi:hypothetical protein J6590_106423 [Homalodisca vitripennis]|nr:hypothetical protein J6590_106423 [Homalodisca vitripennis]